MVKRDSPKLLPLDYYFIGEITHDYCEDCQNFAELNLWNGLYRCRNCASEDIDGTKIKVIFPYENDMKEINNVKKIILTICYTICKNISYEKKYLHYQTHYIPSKIRLKTITDFFYKRIYNKRKITDNLFENALTDLIDNGLIIEQMKKIIYHKYSKTYDVYYYNITKNGIKKYMWLSNFNSELSLIYFITMDNRIKIINIEYKIENILYSLNIACIRYEHIINKRHVPLIKLNINSTY